MTSILLGFGAISAVYALAIRASVLDTDTVNPFAGPATTDSTADTLPTTSDILQTSAPAGKTWQTKTLTNLRHVEDLLDCLEARGFEEREVQILGESTFAVRWR